MFIERAYAKINIGLQVLFKRPDHYHELKMIMCRIQLHDTLLFRKSKKTRLLCTQNVCDIKDNIVYKTILFMKNLYQIEQGVQIYLIKRIRSKAGLGGGSSDAAATIRGLNRLWNLNLNQQQMHEIAENMGSDVPFFLEGKPSIVSGRGENLSNISPIRLSLVLVFPDFQMSTQTVFSKFNVLEATNRFNELLSAINNNDTYKIAQHSFNDLEYAVNTLISNSSDNINEIKKTLMEYGAIGAFMTGSGSTVVGVISDKKKSNEIISKMKRKYPHFTYKKSHTI